MFVQALAANIYILEQCCVKVHCGACHFSRASVGPFLNASLFYAYEMDLMCNWQPIRPDGAGLGSLESTCCQSNVEDILVGVWPPDVSRLELVGAAVGQGAGRVKFGDWMVFWPIG